MKVQKTRCINVKIPESLFQETRCEAIRSCRTNAQVVTEALRLLLAQHAARAAQLAQFTQVTT
ncbi:MAG TPA: hypothetical protein VHC69_15990 [Polyangiaceae bacterium]|nr:hypothetical protein [Polyangiaceae bacterium]